MKKSEYIIVPWVFNQQWRMLPWQPTFLNGISFGVFIAMFALLLLQLSGTGVTIFQSFSEKDGISGAFVIAAMWAFASMMILGPLCALCNRLRDIICFLADLVVRKTSQCWKTFIAPAILPDLFAARNSLRNFIRFFSFK